MMRPKSICPHPGCGKLTEGGACARHVQQRRDESELRRKKKRAGPRYYDTARWKRLRLAVLARDPVCKKCGLHASTNADHVVPREQGGEDAMDNLQGLCGTCHSRKTVQQDGGFGRERVQRGSSAG